MPSRRGSWRTSRRNAAVRHAGCRGAVAEVVPSTSSSWPSDDHTIDVDSIAERGGLTIVGVANGDRSADDLPPLADRATHLRSRSSSAGPASARRSRAARIRIRSTNFDQTEGFGTSTSTQDLRRVLEGRAPDRKGLETTASRSCRLREPERQRSDDPELLPTCCPVPETVPPRHHLGQGRVVPVGRNRQPGRVVGPRMPEASAEPTRAPPRARPGRSASSASSLSLKGRMNCTSGVFSGSKSARVMNSGSGSLSWAPGSSSPNGFHLDSRRRSAVGTTDSISERGSSHRTALASSSVICRPVADASRVRAGVPCCRAGAQQAGDSSVRLFIDPCQRRPHHPACVGVRPPADPVEQRVGAPGSSGRTGCRPGASGPRSPGRADARRTGR